MKKRILGSLFSGLMLCFAAQSAVWATATSITDTDLQWEITDNALTISKNENGRTGNTAIPDCAGTSNQPWKGESGANITTIESVKIGPGVTSIGTDAFFGHTALETVEIADTVTSIGQRAFGDCTSLDTVNAIPSGIKEIKDSTFSGCTNLELTSKTLPEGLEKIGQTAFKNCQSLTFPVIPSTVKEVNKNAFYECTELAKNAVFCPTNINESTRNAADIKKYHVYTVVDKTKDGKLLTKITATTEGTEAEKYKLDCDDMGPKYAITALSTDAAKTATLAHGDIVANETPSTASCDKTQPVAYSKCPKCPLLFVDEASLSKAEKDALTARDISTYTVTDGDDSLTYYVFSSEDAIPTRPGEIHELKEVAATTATCKKPGLAAHYKCACGKLYLKNDADVDALGLLYLSPADLEKKDTYLSGDEKQYYIVDEHDLVKADVDDDGHTLKYYDQIDATCDNNGMKAYAECTECGKLFLLKASKDQEALVREEVSKDELIIPATGHSYGEWKTTETPTTASKGEETRVCANCGASETSTLSKLADENTPGVFSLTPTTYGYAVDTGDFISGEMFAYAYSLCACGVAFVSLRKKKSKV